MILWCFELSKHLYRIETGGGMSSIASPSAPVFSSRRQLYGVWVYTRRPGLHKFMEGLGINHLVCSFAPRRRDDYRTLYNRAATITTILELNLHLSTNQEVPSYQN